MERVTVKFTLEVGRLIARTIEIDLKQYAFAKGVEIDIQKEMGLLSGFLLVKVSGEATKVDWFISVVERWIKENKEG